MKSRVRKAVFPIAGMGTRFLPATKSIPKEILTLVDRPLIQYAIDEARESGIESFIFVTARNKNSLEDYFDRAPHLERILQEQGKEDLLAEITATTMPSGAISYVRQHDPLGNGDAIRCARRLIGNEPFAVLFPDDIIRSDTPCLKQLIDVHSECGGNVVALQEVDAIDVNKYGIVGGEASIDQDRLFRIDSIVEKPEAFEAPSLNAVIGRYILDPRVINEIEHISPCPRGELQITDAIMKSIDFVNTTGVFFEGRRHDCGSKKGYLEATVSIALEHHTLGSGFKEFLESEMSP
jgi:UTP--glucose-1-phosphate uridylyltransferase